MTKEEKKVTLESNIMEVVQSNPKTAEIFMKHGLPCVGCAASRFEKISDVIAEFGIDGEVLIDELNQAMKPSLSEAKNEEEKA